MGAVLKRIILGFCLLPASISNHVSAQIMEGKDLFNEISAIKAIDNHAHPLTYVARNEKPDNEFDALPLDAIPAFPLPVRLNPTNPEFIHAWHDLYGYLYNDMSETHMHELMNTKQRELNERGNSFPLRPSGVFTARLP